MNSKQLYRERIIDLLDKNQQRASYGAIGGVVDLPAQSVMQGLEKNYRYSWIVNTTTYLPTGYTDEEMHPQLKSKQLVLDRKSVV